MEFDWDEANITHIARHGVTVADAEYVLRHNPMQLGFQDWHGEERFSEVGATALGRVLVVVYTWREAKMRVVTAYTAPRALRMAFSKSLR